MTESELIEKVATQLSDLSCHSDVEEVFDDAQLNKLAFATKFISRSTAQMKGHHFFDLQVNYLSTSPEKERSLTDLSTYLLDKHGVKISNSSLDSRYDHRGVSFMKSCLDKVMNKFMSQLALDLPLSTNFKGIKIHDSIKFELPSNLSTHYPKHSKDASKGACIKIHYSYDLLQSDCHHIQLAAGHVGEVNAWKGIEVTAQELHIQDLGFFSQHQYQQLHKGGAFFLSRYKTGVYLGIKDETGTEQPLNLEQVLADNQETICYFPEVYLGKKKRIPVRLIALKVPDEIKQARIKRCEADYKTRPKNGKYPQLSQLKRFLCGYNLFITNAKEEDLPTQHIALFYTLRWQIELLFRIWKSIFKIHCLPKMDICRFECFLYGRLIAIMLCAGLFEALRNMIAQESNAQIELSEWKVIKMLKKKIPELKKAMRKGPEAVKKFWTKFIKQVIEKAKKEKKKKPDKQYKPSPFDILKLLKN